MVVWPKPTFNSCLKINKISSTSGVNSRWRSNLPDDAVEVFEVRLDFLHRLLQQPAVGTDAHVGHSVDSHQGFHQPAHWMEGGLRRLARELGAYLVKSFKLYMMAELDEISDAVCYQSRPASP